jgi:hypothetical protein
MYFPGPFEAPGTTKPSPTPKFPALALPCSPARLDRASGSRTPTRSNGCATCLACSTTDRYGIAASGRRSSWRRTWCGSLREGDPPRASRAPRPGPCGNLRFATCGTCDIGWPRSMRAGRRDVIAPPGRLSVAGPATCADIEADLDAAFEGLCHRAWPRCMAKRSPMASTIMRSLGKPRLLQFERHGNRRAPATRSG